MTQELVVNITGTGLTPDTIIILSTASTILILQVLIWFRLGKNAHRERHDWTEISRVIDGADDADAVPTRDHAGHRDNDNGMHIPPTPEIGARGLENYLRLGIERTGRQISGYLIPPGIKIREVKTNQQVRPIPFLQATVQSGSLY